MCLVEVREKKRLAAELQDSPVQNLAIAQIQIAAAANRQGPESAQGFEDGLELLRDALRGPAGGGGYGLYSMRERLALWGGDLSVESDGSGTRVTLRAPVGPQATGVSSDVRRSRPAAASQPGGASA
jgi:signal transduction histidine kinase